MSTDERKAALERGDLLCLSNDPGCSGLRPCDQCREFWRSAVLPTAMHLAGGSFIASQEQALSFMAAWDAAYDGRLTELLDEIMAHEGIAIDDLLPDEAHATAAPTEEGRAEDEQRVPEAADTLRVLLQGMTKEELADVKQQIDAGTFPDLQALHPEELAVMKEVLTETFGEEGGEATAPTEPPVTDNSADTKTDDHAPSEDGKVVEDSTNPAAQDVATDKE